MQDILRLPSSPGLESLRGTTPSDALLDSAATPGLLDTPDGVAALAENDVVAAAIRDKDPTPPNFGRGSGTGQIDAIRV